MTPGKSAVGGVLGGGGFEWRTRENISFFASGGVIGFSDQSTVVTARGGVRPHSEAQQIIAVAQPLGIAVHDHIVVGKDEHASLKGLELI